MMTTRIKRWRAWLIYPLVFLAIMITANAWKTRHAPEGNLSAFGGVLMDGRAFTLAEFSGRPVLIYFWATWCPICSLGNDNVQSISQDYPVISIASWSESEAAVAAYMQENGLDFPVMLDNDGSLAQQFGLSGVPTSFIIAPDGDIAFVETGYSTEAGLRLRLWLSRF